MTEQQPINQDQLRIKKSHVKLGCGTLTVAGLSIAGTVLALNMLGGMRPASGEPGATFNPTPSPTEGVKPTPSPSEAAGSPSPSPEQAKYNIVNEDSIPEGLSRELPAFTVVIGDAKKIDGQKWTDTDAGSGLVTILTEPATVEAGTTYKIDYATVENLEEAKYLAAKIQQDIKDSGCVDGNGCNHVDALLFPGDKQGVQQSLDLSQYLDNSNQATPSSSPEASHPANCTCNCCVAPTPTPTPNTCVTPTPSATPAPASCETSDNEYPFVGGPDSPKAKIIKLTGDRIIVQGDASINGAVRYDSNGSTGLITVLESDTPRTYSINNGNGLDGQVFPKCVSNAQFESTLKDDVNGMLASHPGGVLEVTINNGKVVNSVWVYKPLK